MYYNQSMVPKLKFIVDSNYDWAMLQVMRHSLTKQFRKLRSKDRFMIIHRRLAPTLRITASMYQSAWDEIGDYFFKRAEAIVKHPWKFNRYYCVVSMVHRGVSSWGGNKIVRSWTENPYAQRKITAHELLITYLWDYLGEHAHCNLSSTQRWAFCEISAWAITGLDDKLVRKAWPWISDSERWPMEHNYPQLVAAQRRAKALYEKMTDFDAYSEKLITIIQNQPGMKSPR